jgi:hypothetical protein
VVTPEFAGTHNGDTDSPGLSWRRAHSLFIPFEGSLGSGAASGGNA